MSRRIWGQLGFSRETFAGKICLDIGAGPTARCVGLDGTWWAIEPLAESYVWMPYDRVWAVPAEQFIPELVDAVDYVVSLNALDHCFDLPAILCNAHRYLRRGGYAFWSFDVDKPITDDPTHPLVMTHDEADAAIREAGFRVIRRTHGKCYPRLSRKWRSSRGQRCVSAAPPWIDSWGGGTAYHWLCKREDVPFMPFA